MYGYTTFHEKIMTTLINSVHNKLASHTYIFEGADGLLKHSNAELFATALTCLNESTAPCGACRSCIESKAGTNPDIAHIVREEGEDGKPKKTLGIDPIRSAIKDAQIRPFNAPRKVYIIDEGDLMTDDAQNSFLKTLEEPPEYVVFIIIVKNSGSLLQTVRSRSVLIHFPAVSDSIVKEYITEKYPDETDRIDFLIKYCSGIPGDADKIINNPDFEELRQKSLQALPLLLSPKTADAFSVQKFVNENSDNVDIILDCWVSFLRDIIVIQCGVTNNIMNPDKVNDLRRITSAVSDKSAVKAIDEILKTKNMINRSVKQSSAILHCALSINN